MSELKDDIVNKAIIYTRAFRPIEFDSMTGRPTIKINAPTGYQDLMSLIELCLSVQKFIYGEEANESDEHKNRKNIQSNKD